MAKFPWIFQQFVVLERTHSEVLYAARVISQVFSENLFGSVLQAGLSNRTLETNVIIHLHPKSVLDSTTIETTQ